jgi:uncharacterized protein YrzB (UPF0473 family)
VRGILVGCSIDGNNSRQTLDLIFAGENKGYPKETLAKIRELVVQAKSWLSANIGDVDNDLIAIRGGVTTMTLYLDANNNPYTDAETLSEQIYKNLFDGDTSYLMQSFVGLDYVKITSRNRMELDLERTPGATPEQMPYSNNFNMYHYASPFVHKVFGNYFVNGVYNATKPKVPTKKLIANLGTYTDYIPYLSSIDLRGVKSPIGFIPVRYDGSLGTPTGYFEEVPEVLKELLTLIVQNIYLFSQVVDVDRERDGKERVLVGDKYVNTVSGFIQALDRVDATCDERLNRFADDQDGTDYYQDVKTILEYTGLDQAFKDLRYGGELEDLRLLIRIPASYEMEKELRSYLERQEVIEEWNKYHSSQIDDTSYGKVHEDWYFNRVFPIQTIPESSEEAYSEKAIEGNEVKKPDLWDKREVVAALNRRVNGKAASYEDLYTINSWYETFYRLNDIIVQPYPVMSDNTKGCEVVTTTTGVDGEGNEVTTTSRSYRVYRVNYEWLKNAPTNVQVSLLFAGLDFYTTMKGKCKNDQILAIIIIIIVTYLTWGTATKGMTAFMKAVYVASVVISIGLTAGVWEGKAARNMAILAAVMSLGASLAAQGVSGMTSSMNAVMRTTLTVASTMLQVYNTVEAYELERDLDKHAAEMEKFTEGAELFESNLRMVYGGSFSGPIRNTTEKDPYENIKEMYSRFSTYKDEGFMGNGFNRPLTYGFG